MCEEEIQVTENIIARNKELEEKNKELGIAINNLWKGKIDGKITMLKMEEQYDYIDHKKEIKILQELLEERN